MTGVTPEMIDAGLKAHFRAGTREATPYFTAVYEAMRSLDPEVNRLREALVTLRPRQTCIYATEVIERVFAETAILLSHPDKGRRAVAKERVLDALAQTQSQAPLSHPRETILVSPEDYDALADAIENPPEPTEALKKLWRREK